MFFCFYVGLIAYLCAFVILGVHRYAMILVRMREQSAEIDSLLLPSGFLG